MDSLTHFDGDDCQICIREMLDLQLSELEMLQSMFPNSDEFSLDDPVVMTEIREFLDGKIAYDYLNGRIGFCIKLSPGDQKVCYTL